ncbi:hypothetical protein H839_08933 [Parageobacillus genomosp. 1]|uniref:Uncharacterized protein n=1 Tax=Parageobacillus genomosp. 1 TaxID=1295642 RepID=A0ABC9VE24_9BACL|nr:hypothetical protein H839_08933 [Parageobacillus genomosp. 1]
MECVHAVFTYNVFVHVFDVIKSFLPPMSELLRLIKPNKPPVILLADLDGDKDAELAVVILASRKKFRFPVMKLFKINKQKLLNFT